MHHRIFDNTVDVGGGRMSMIRIRIRICIRICIRIFIRMIRIIIILLVVVRIQILLQNRVQTFDASGQNRIDRRRQ